MFTPANSFLRAIANGLLAAFVVSMLIGHNEGLIDTFMGHLTGRHPIPMWSYIILAIGLAALVLDLVKTKAAKKN